MKNQIRLNNSIDNFAKNKFLNDAVSHQISLHAYKLFEKEVFESKNYYLNKTNKNEIEVIRIGIDTNKKRIFSTTIRDVIVLHEFHNFFNVDMKLLFIKNSNWITLILGIHIAVNVH